MVPNLRGGWLCQIWYMTFSVDLGVCVDQSHPFFLGGGVGVVHFQSDLGGDTENFKDFPNWVLTTKFSKFFPDLGGGTTKSS